MDYFYLRKKDFIDLECIFKHFCAIREYGIEYITTIVATQVCETAGSVQDLIKKLYLISSVTGDVEELTMEFMNYFVSVATVTEEIKNDVSTIRVSKEDLAKFIMQYGNFVAIEEHFADQIKKWVAKLQEADKETEIHEVKNKIWQLTKFLNTTRLIRKKYLSSFIES